MLYALKYRPKQFHRDEINSLLSNGFLNYAFYLIFRFLSNQGSQKALREKIANQIHDESMLCQVVRNYASTLIGYNYDGAKLAQLERVGYDQVNLYFEQGIRKII